MKKLLLADDHDLVRETVADFLRLQGGFHVATAQTLSGALEANMADILSFPDVDGPFDGPTLFLTGGNSAYVTPEDRPMIKSLFPAARFAKLPDAGHWLHAEKPREFEAAVRVFLDA